MYGRREKREREAGFPRTREAGEKGKNYATLRNISQSKKCKGREPKNTGREAGLKATGSGRFKPRCPPLKYVVRFLSTNSTRIGNTLKHVTGPKKK